MTNLKKRKEKLIRRWSEEDYPGGTPRFQLGLLAKDVAIYCLIPLVAIVLFKIVESSVSNQRRPVIRRRQDLVTMRQEKLSQIIHLQPGHSRTVYGVGRKSPGTIIKVRLMNSVETYSTTPVHAQIIDSGLGPELIGGTLLGEATPQPQTGRVVIEFKYVKHPKRADLALPICARAMSLDGTFGLVGTKKEGIFARAAIRSASGNPNVVDTSPKDQDFKSLIARAVAAGLMQEFQSESSVAYNQAQVLTVRPLTEFLVELTDYFSGQR